MENDKTYLRDINGCSIEQHVIYSGTEYSSTFSYVFDKEIETSTGDD